MTDTVTLEQIKQVKSLGFLHNKGTDRFNGRIITVNGKITAEQMAVIAEAAEKYGNGEVEFTTRLSIEVRGIRFADIEPFRNFVSRVGLETGGTGSLVRPIVSCKGTTCQFGLYDTFALSQKIYELFYKGYQTVKLPHKFKITVGGCPNNCVKPTLNDVGITGQMVPNVRTEMCRGCKKCRVEAACPVHVAQLKDGSIDIDPKSCLHCGRCVGKCPFHVIEDGTPGFLISIGGRWGKKIAQGQPLQKLLTSEEEVLAIVEKAILLFRDQGITGERFSDTIARLRFENVQKQLFSDELLQRKQEIIA